VVEKKINSTEPFPPTKDAPSGVRNPRFLITSTYTALEEQLIQRKVRHQPNFDHITAAATDRVARLRTRLISSANNAKYWLAGGVNQTTDLGMAILTGKQYQPVISGCPKEHEFAYRNTYTGLVEEQLNQPTQTRPLVPQQQHHPNSHHITAGATDSVALLHTRLISSAKIAKSWLGRGVKQSPELGMTGLTGKQYQPIISGCPKQHEFAYRDNSSLIPQNALGSYVLSVQFNDRMVLPVISNLSQDTSYPIVSKFTKSPKNINSGIMKDGVLSSRSSIQEVPKKSQWNKNLPQRKIKSVASVLFKFNESVSHDTMKGEHDDGKYISLGRWKSMSARTALIN
jgi:hypothetical protein